MDNSLLIIVLAVGTLGAVLAVGFIQRGRIRQSQLKRGEVPPKVVGD